MKTLLRLWTLLFISMTAITLSVSLVSAQAKTIKAEKVTLPKENVWIATPIPADSPLKCPGGQPICTHDVKTCPDGSTVSRTGCNCEFAACPGENTQETTAPPGNSCARAGCSGQLCVEANLADQISTTCEYLDEYACYQQATCERQANGQCGFTSTPELQACLANPQQTVLAHPVSWQTDHVKLEADDFFILANGQKFTGQNATFQLHANPANHNYTTLEVQWQEHQVPMRLNIYFRKNGQVWWSNEIRTANGLASPNDDWNYFKLGNTDNQSFFRKELGQTFTQGEWRWYVGEGNNRREVYFKNLRLQAFTNPSTPPFGDFSQNGSVGLEDYSLFVSAYHNNPHDPLYDLNFDNKLSLFDYTLFIHAYKNS